MELHSDTKILNVAKSSFLPKLIKEFRNKDYYDNYTVNNIYREYFYDKIKKYVDDWNKKNAEVTRTFNTVCSFLDQNKNLIADNANLNKNKMEEAIKLSKELSDNIDKLYKAVKKLNSKAISEIFFNNYYSTGFQNSQKYKSQVEGFIKPYLKNAK